MKLTGHIFLAGLISALSVSPVSGQNSPDPRGAFLRSMAIPGWGHYYADSENPGRGRVHFIAEAIMAVSFVGLRNRASILQERYTTLASLKAGTDISDRNRSYRLAVGEYGNLQEYNDFQLRSRNWHRILEANTANQWEWQSDADRQRYNRLRSDHERVRNQLPAILGLMVVNRVISAVSAYNRARAKAELPEISVSPVQHDSGIRGVTATFYLRF